MDADTVLSGEEPDPGIKPQAVKARQRYQGLPLGESSHQMAKKDPCLKVIV